jgi:hypothetical protein
VKKCLYCSDLIQLNVGPEEEKCTTANTYEVIQLVSTVFRSLPNFQPLQMTDTNSQCLQVYDIFPQWIGVLTLDCVESVSLFCHILITFVMYYNKLRDCKILFVNTLSLHHLIHFILISVHKNLHKFHNMQHLNLNHHLS